MAELIDRALGPLTILFGYENGKYPQGNSLVIRGDDQSAIVDPSLGVVARKENLPVIDMVIHSHTHEDHVAGSHLFDGMPWYCHPLDEPGLASIEGMMTMYGIADPVVREHFQEDIVRDFHYMAAKDLRFFEEGDVLDFGGVTLEVLHTPGHTRGHCCFLISWGEEVSEKLVYLGDIELTGFGPYYGDAWSDLEDFERSIERLKSVEAHWWLTFHHKGLIEGRDEFLTMLEKFGSMIDDREHRLLEFIAEPRTMAEIVEHRFIYRPGQGDLLVDAIEERSMSLHLDRLVRQGRVTESEGRFKVRP